MSFNESNTVEQMILDALSSRSGGSGGAVGRARRCAWLGRFARWRVGALLAGNNELATDVPRQPGEVMAEPWLRLGAHPTQSRNRRPTRSSRRSDLRVTGDSAFRSGGWIGKSQPEFYGLAAW